MTFVRTVLGDVDPGELGVTYAHEHLVIDGGRPVELSPDFLLADVDRMATELADAAAAGLQTAIDAMPADCGRNPAKLAELSRRTGVRIVAATGLHHERFYAPSHWSTRASEDELADLFVADVEEGIDERDYGGPIVRRTDVRAGIVKVAGSEGGPSARDLPIFRAAAATHRRTGVPVHTHCEAGTGALEQLRVLLDAGVPASRVSLSHVDKVVDRGYHRELLSTGAFAVYDQAFRWGDRDNGTIQLIEWAVEDGTHGQLMLGMDAARQGYYQSYGGRPGLSYLLREFSGLLEARGDPGRRPRLDVRRRAGAGVRVFDRVNPESRGRRMSEELLTSVVGSHAHPGWFDHAIAAAERGEYGPADLEELLDDGVELAIRDQERAGIDVITDGEMRRAGFFTAEFYRHLTGVRALPASRRLGVAAHDALPRFAVETAIEAPNGLGVVGEFEKAHRLTDRPFKVTLPGPFTLSGRLVSGPGEVYKTRVAAAEAFVPILRDEIRGLVDAGAAIIQVDEPSAAIHPSAGADFASLLNEALAPARGRARLGAHLCFGNFLGRPLAPRTYRPILDAMLGFHVEELVLEYANREMSEVDVLRDIADAGRDVAVGVIDVKNSYVETADDVARRTELVLDAGVPAARLTLVPDCGFSQTARHLAVAKMRALVAGRDLVRGAAATRGTVTQEVAR